MLAKVAIIGFVLGVTSVVGVRWPWEYYVNNCLGCTQEGYYYCAYSGTVNTGSCDNDSHYWCTTEWKDYSGVQLCKESMAPAQEITLDFDNNQCGQSNTTVIRGITITTSCDKIKLVSAISGSRALITFKNNV